MPPSPRLVTLRRSAVALALGLAVLLVAAAPASAHALLLRTDPSPQSTVPTSPAAVRLYFSEPVEAGAGDVRVYDVDGNRVDKDKVHRTGGNREVVVDVPHLADGTYTVTWRAVSSDTHPVRGGFVFYVGHPSSISAVAVAQPHPASRAVTYGFGVIRFLWYAALIGIVGLVVVRRWAWTPTLRDARLLDSDAADRFRRSFSHALIGAWVVLALSGIAALGFQSAVVSGRPFLQSLRPSSLHAVIDRAYGHGWLVEMALVALLLLPVAGLARRTRLLGVPPDVWIWIGGLVVGGLCAVSAWQGHARTDARPALTVASVAVHLFAVGVWAGGLATVVLVARPAWHRAPEADQRSIVSGVVRRFSTIAIGSVIVVAATGTISALADFHGISDLWRYGYGRVVGLKIALLVIAVIVAARHRFVTPRRLDADAPTEVRRFGSWAGTELVALVGAVALAAALVAMVPGRTLALAANGPVNTDQKVGDYTVQLLVDPTHVGRNDVHVTFIGSTGLAAAEVTTAEVTLTPPAGTAGLLAMRLIGPGHFVGETDLPSAGRYHVNVRSPQASTTFTFTVRKGA